MNESFLSPLIVTPQDDGIHWVLVDGFTLEDTVLGFITAPVGFVTDFCSTPRIFWDIIPPWGKYGKATIIHDYLYARQQLIGKPITQKDADQCLFRAMGILGVDETTRLEIYGALRVGGFVAWDGHTKALMNIKG